MYSKISLFVVATFFVFSETAYVDTLTKCHSSDKPCSKKFLEDLLTNIASTGIPEIGLPPIDPVALKNINVNILNNIDLTVVDGDLHGIKNCKINEFGISQGDKKTILDMTCDFQLKGTYTLFSSSPLITGLTGGKPIRGEGVGEFNIEKINLSFELFYEYIKKGDEYFVDLQDSKTKYKFTGPENMKISANNLYIGDVESSKEVVALINGNWKTLFPAFSGGFYDKVVEILSTFLHKFFDNVPVHKYATDDVSVFV